MQITIDTMMFIAILSLLFLVGVISGIKIAYAKLIIKVLKKISPNEFERLMEEDNESGKHSPIDPGCMHKHAEGETTKYKVSPK